MLTVTLNSETASWPPEGIHPGPPDVLGPSQMNAVNLQPQRTAFCSHTPLSDGSHFLCFQEVFFKHPHAQPSDSHMRKPEPSRVLVKEEQLEAYGTSAKLASPPNLQWPRFWPGWNPAVPKGPSLGLFTTWGPHRNLAAANGTRRILPTCGTNTG